MVFIGFASYGQIPENYYSSANGLYREELKAALHNIIDDHTALSYDDDLTDALRVTDEDTLNTNNVICFYTGWSYPKTAFGNLYNNWNREHTWSKSHGDFGDSPPEGTDLHHLRACDASVNSAKGNKDFSKGTTQYYDSGIPTGCYTAPYIWEPRDSDKGDVARALFYMATRYEGDNGEVDLELVSYVNTAPNGEPFYGNLDTLIKWHETDPVNNWERNRNDIVYYQYQGNRNPFVDHPEYVDLIWGNEPLAHATDFSAHNIVLSWVEPTTGTLPDAYLIRKSTAGFESISSPTDGVFIGNDEDNINVAYGNGQFTFKGAIPGQTYYIKIFPYKGTGDLVNYKTDGNIQQVEILIN